MTPLAPVWNATERRLRAPIRVVLTAVVVVAVAVGLTLALGAVTTPPTAPQVAVAVTSTVTAVAALVGCLVAARLLDRRRLRDYGLGVDADWLLDLVAGTALGGLLMTGVLAVSLAAGWATVTGTARVTGGLSFPAALLVVVLAFVAVAVGEEVAVRGYLLTNLAEGSRALGERLAVSIAVLGSAGAFGALHAANPAATAVSVAGVALGGMMLGLGYVFTGRLGFPVGLHFSWNLLQGPVYGFPVSGFDVGVSVLALSVRGPAYLTGGEFGPEAGLAGIGAVAVGTALTVGYGRLRYGGVDRTAVLVPDLRWWEWDDAGARGSRDPRLVGADDAPGSETSPYEE